MNLETIARLSGVSRSTVSRVINNSPNVRPAVRERVLKVLRETNFQPNVAARSLAAGSTHILGLVIPTGVSHLFVDPYFPLLIQGVSSACNTHDYTIMLWLEEPEYERRMIRQILHSGLIDGVVITSFQANDPLVDALVERRFPFVAVGRLPEHPDAHFVDVDNIGSARLAVDHLLRLGRERIAMITGPLNMTPSADRHLGYRTALESAGKPFVPEWTVEGDFTQEGGFSAMQRLLPYKPDAVFSSSDAMAQGAALAITESGLRVPDDIALVGFDDLPFAVHMQPKLTTIHQPIEQMGFTAVEILVSLLNHTVPEAPLQKILPTELMVRESCGSRIGQSRTLLGKTP